MEQHDITTVLNRIQQRWGQNAIRPASKLQDAPEVLPTGYALLDERIGGLPKSAVSELAAVPTAGAATLVCHIMARVQRAGQPVVYIDMDSTFDSGYAAHCGLSLDDLLLVEAHEIGLVLTLIREIAASGVVGLLVVNLLSFRQRELDLRPLMPAVHFAQTAVLLLVAPGTKSNTAALHLHMKRQKWLREGHDIVGVLSTVTVEKNRSGKVGDAVTLLIPLHGEAWA